MDTNMDVAAKLATLLTQLNTVIVGKEAQVRDCVACLLAGGHLLIEDVPGVGKTSLALALARASGASSQRIQFTSDLLPTDVTGVSVYDGAENSFRFHPGPIFASVVLADEINRATPKTQSALLEAMGEGTVTVDGRTFALPEPFMVVATQNPVDMEGTFALPEAQRDRFMARLSLGYPGPEAEASMVRSHVGPEPLDHVEAVTSPKELMSARAEVARLHMAPDVVRYLVALVGATRGDPAIALGASPRATLHLAAVARARAAMRGRDYVSPDDVAACATSVLAHRLVPSGRFTSAAEGHAAARGAVERIVAALTLGRP